MSSFHTHAKEVFLAALERPDQERAAFLAEACANDPTLRHEVESLLQFHDASESTDAGPAAIDTPFTTGQVFAGRYRMIARIGRGGMGDVWRADDLVLETEVALKVIWAAPEARGRLLNEVRLARQITHPSVCRVFDVGEADGWIFYSMELIRGQDLAALLRRIGRLPSDKVIDIGRQLCGGLAAAHARGVLHRDLKPANVLIDDNGAVRITDFGIAIPRASGEAHTLSGTPAYMAPEQRMLGTPLTEQTDLYALGLLLYELVVGDRPLLRGTKDLPPSPSSFVTDVEPLLSDLIMQALSPDPSGRPASALDMGARLSDIDASHTTIRPAAFPLRGGLRPSWWLLGAGIAGVVAIAALAAPFFVSPGSKLSEQDTIVLADFENRTGETVFDGALKVALAVALEQSPFLKVFPDERARETLRLMERSPDERVTPSIAREIARREQLKALIAGSIGSLGRNYVITLEAVSAETGDVMAREQSEAPSKEEVLTALGAATTRLREKLGESLVSVQKFDVPLPRATTPSLEALHAYSLALYEGREVPRLESIPHLKRAIELDPTFAMAHAQLSAVYANTGQSGLAPEFSRKAFELRDRVSERERFFISWRYYRDAIQAWDKALELARSWTAAYPREAFAFNSYASALLRFGRFEESVEPYRESIRLDPKFIPAYSNLAAAYLALDRVGEARAILQEATDRNLEFVGARRLSYLIAFVEGDGPMMERELKASVGLGETNAAFGWQADTLAFAGRMSAAHEQFRRGVQMALQGEFREVAAQLTVKDAETHAIVGQCEPARTEMADGLQLSRDNLTLERASRALALCGASREANALTAELARRFPEATLTIDLSLPITAAANAIRAGDPARGVEILEQVRRFDRAPSGEFWPAYLRGQAYLELKDAQAAAVEFRSIIEHRGEVPASALYPLAQLGLARARRLSGDATSGKAYEDFFAKWREADADLAALTAARLEYSQLP